jgi:hypothetical protein
MVALRAQSVTDTVSFQLAGWSRALEKRFGS